MGGEAGLGSGTWDVLTTRVVGLRWTPSSGARETRVNSSSNTYKQEQLKEQTCVEECELYKRVNFVALKLVTQVPAPGKFI